MAKTAREILDSPAFHRLVARRWTVSLASTAALFLAYYGFIVLVALDKAFLARRIGEVTTLGIPLAVGVIVVSWILALLYARWTRRVHDPEVAALRRELES